MATQNRAGKATARKASAAKPTTAGQPAAAGKTGQQGRADGQTRNAAGQSRGGQGRTGQQGRAGQARRTEQPLEARATAPGTATTQAEAGVARSRWRDMVGYPGAHKVEFAALVASVLGLAVSIYLTIEHFSQSISLAGCPENATINCVKVTTSAQSHVFGIPVAVLGLAFFVFMVAINSPWGWRADRPIVHWARLASVIVGIVFVLYLVYAELFLINAICLYCTSVHVLTFILFALIVGRASMSGVAPARR
jgi:uncharacterized membrane protein